MSLEISDLTVVSTDGKRATAEALVWSNFLQDIVTVRLEAHLSDFGFSIECTSCADAALGIAVTQSPEVRADITEAIKYQKDVLREKN